jgi:hypothetical protein
VSRGEPDEDVRLERAATTGPARVPSTLDGIAQSDERAWMGLLEQVTSPADLRDLTDAQVESLASEIRDELVRTCAPRGGHLGPNLGVVELTLAIHRTFDSPRDRVVWDTGHQAYVHKMLTGRATQFDTSSRTPTPPPRFRTPTGSPRRTPSGARTVTSWP